VGSSEQGNPILEWDERDIPTNSAGIEIPIPENFQLIKQNEPQLALDWRLKVRGIFQTLFRAEYALVSVNRTTLGIHYYQVVKRNTIPLNTKRGEIE
jgi:predicted GNAT superfamily acetyltransferase